MNQLSQTLKNFLTEFQLKALPLINKEEALGMPTFSLTVSSTTLRDPQLRELLGMSENDTKGTFLGISVAPAPDMAVNVFSKGSE